MSNFLQQNTITIYKPTPDPSTSSVIVPPVDDAHRGSVALAGDTDGSGAAVLAGLFLLLLEVREEARERQEAIVRELVIFDGDRFKLGDADISERRPHARLDMIETSDAPALVIAILETKLELERQQMTPSASHTESIQPEEK